jgi:putative glutathione S-transferase
MVENGWEFSDTEPLYGAAFLHQTYTRARSDYTGRVTVPVLWDKQTHQIVNNESSEIIRMFNGEFESLSSNDLDFWPADLRESIEVVNERVYSGINNGVYKAGFATSQEAYDKAVVALFDTLDWVERLLAKQPYLVGATLTEADWRLFTTLLRFDLVYVTHFKCDRKRIVDYPNLWAYTRQLLSIPGVAETFDIPAIREHYFRSHASINPHQIISIGPNIDWSAAHDRDPNPLDSVRRHP